MRSGATSWKGGKGALVKFSEAAVRGSGAGRESIEVVVGLQDEDEGLLSSRRGPKGVMKAGRGA